MAEQLPQGHPENEGCRRFLPFLKQAAHSAINQPEAMRTIAEALTGSTQAGEFVEEKLRQAAIARDRLGLSPNSTQSTQSADTVEGDIPREFRNQ